MMTRRPPKPRDWEKYPLTLEERMELLKAHRRMNRAMARIEKRSKFNARARANNTKHGIKPRKGKNDG